MRAAEIDHRLDGEEHAGLEQHAFAAAAVMEDVGFVVKQAAKAMTAKIAHDGTAFGFGIFLNRGADVARRRARPHGRHAAHQRFIGHFDEALRPAGDIADEIHPARIAVPAVEDQGHVDVDDVAVLERFAVGHAVANDMIERGADRFAIAAIVERRGIGVMRHREIEDERVERLRGDAGPHMLGQEVKRLGGQPAGPAHSGEGLRPVQFDMARLAACNFDSVNKGHVSGSARCLPDCVSLPSI